MQSRSKRAGAGASSLTCLLCQHSLVVLLQGLQLFRGEGSFRLLDSGAFGRFAFQPTEHLVILRVSRCPRLLSCKSEGGGATEAT